MRFGYWLPVFGGWLRNVDDESMEATWGYVMTPELRATRQYYGG
jgi:FMNH2-dependent dimethyl sulfone monooxygenase